LNLFMMQIKITKVNNTYIHIDTSEDIARELTSFFSIYADGYKFHPKYKARLWDGKLYFFNKRTGYLYAGLLGNVIQFATDIGYSVELSSDVKNMFKDDSVTKDNFLTFTKSFSISKSGAPIDWRPAQMFGLYKAIKAKRLTMTLCTGGGKSLIIYGLIRYLQETTPGKILLIVPTTMLVNQFYSDLEDYSSEDDDWEVAEHCARLYSEYDYDPTKQVLISTWQSLQNWHKQDKANGVDSRFEQFDAVIVDETHGAKGTQIKNILEACINAEYRYGLTGTLDGQEGNRLQIVGTLGPVLNIQSSREAMDDGTLVPLDITCLELTYPEQTKQFFKKTKPKYQQEIEYICDFTQRNEFITKLANSLEGNTLILFTKVEKHGKIIYDHLKENTDRPVYYIHGGVDAEEREEIRTILSKESNSILAASFGTLSTGVNIPSISNIIFASPSKSMIRVLQSIGRGLRNSEGKVDCKLYDLVDNINGRNFAYNHFVERAKIYSSQQFNFRVTPISFK
jgi:superfamily II DNA or RNA helicase